jgi:small subunit ribosomal protein S4
MSRITVSTKCRLCRAAGGKLFLKGTRCLSSKCPIEKKGAVKPGMHGAKRPSKPTDYGIQLRAKQKAKRIYGVQETQFRNIYLKAKNMKGLVGENLLSLVERRLDNVIYLAGISLSRSSAKQLISHKHILVNKKVHNISSYQVKVGDVISLDKEIAKKIGDLPLSEKDFNAPSWLDVNSKELSVKVTDLPNLEEIKHDVDVDLIIEYYSR